MVLDSFLLNLKTTQIRQSIMKYANDSNKNNLYVILISSYGSI